eukprot:SAG22_NODE_10690_length_520_cov_2.517815_1_plen_96_part_10
MQELSAGDPLSIHVYGTPSKKSQCHVWSCEVSASQPGAASMEEGMEMQATQASTHANAPTTLIVGGMVCGNCSGKVERALAAVDGVESAEVDLAAG